MGRIGIDIGGSGVKAVRLDEAGRRSCARVAYTTPDIDTLVSAIREASDEVGLRTTDTLGVCAPGVQDPKRGEVTYAANLPCLSGVRVGELVAKTCGIPGVGAVLTDAVAFGLGSWRLAPIEGRLLTLAMGTGVGAALIEDGHPLTLDGATIGHVGQMDVSFGESDPPIGPDGGRGSLEGYVGWPALVSRFGEGGVVAGIARMKTEDRAIRALVRAIRIGHAMYKPGVIRLVGGVGALFEPLVPVLHSAASDRLTGVARPGWQLETMNDPSLAAIGAAWSA